MKGIIALIFILSIVFTLNSSNASQKIWDKLPSMVSQGGARDISIKNDILIVNNNLFIDLKTERILSTQDDYSDLSSIPPYENYKFIKSIKNNFYYLINIWNLKDTLRSIEFENLNSEMIQSVKEFNQELSFKNNWRSLFKVNNNKLCNFVRWDINDNWSYVEWNLENGSITKNISILNSNNSEIIDFIFDESNENIYFVLRNNISSDLYNINLNSKFVNKVNINKIIERVYESNEEFLIYKFYENNEFYIGIFDKINQKYNKVKTNPFQEKIGLNGDFICFGNEYSQLVKINKKDINNVIHLNAFGYQDYVIYNNRIIALELKYGYIDEYSLDDGTLTNSYSITQLEPITIQTNSDESLIGVFFAYDLYPGYYSLSIFDIEGKSVGKFALTNEFGKFNLDFNRGRFEFGINDSLIYLHDYNENLFIVNFYNGKIIEKSFVSNILDVESLNENEIFITFENKDLLLFDIHDETIRDSLKTSKQIMKLVKNNGVFKTITINENNFLELDEFDFNQNELISKSMVLFQFNKYEPLNYSYDCRYVTAKGFVYDVENEAVILSDRNGFENPFYMNLVYDYNFDKNIYFDDNELGYEGFLKIKDLFDSESKFELDKDHLLYPSTRNETNQISAAKFLDKGNKFLGINREGFIFMLDISEILNVKDLSKTSCQKTQELEYFDLLGNKLEENNIYNKQIIVRYKCLETGEITHKLEIRER